MLFFETQCRHRLQKNKKNKTYKSTLKFKNCSPICAYYWAELSYTAQHITVLIIFPLILQTNAIDRMLSLEAEREIHQIGLTSYSASLPSATSTLHLCHNKYLAVNKESTTTRRVEVHNGKMGTDEIWNVLGKITASLEIRLTSNYHSICNNHQQCSFVYLVKNGIWFIEDDPNAGNSHFTSNSMCASTRNKRLCYGRGTAQRGCQ